jgi:hypothetical protein
MKRVYRRATREEKPYEGTKREVKPMMPAGKTAAGATLIYLNLNRYPLIQCF